MSSLSLSQEQEVSVAIESFFDKVCEVNSLSERVKAVPHEAASLENVALLEHSIECLMASLEGTAISVPSDSQLSLESRLGQISQKLGDIVVRIYRAIINGIKWLMEVLAGEQAKIRYKRQYVESTLASAEVLMNEIRNSTKKPKRGNFKHARINQHLSLGGSVNSALLLATLSNMRTMTKEVLRYSKAQRANLSRVIGAQEKDSLSLADFTIEPRPASIKNEVPELELTFRNIKRYFKVYKSMELPGNTALLYRSFKENTTVGLVRNSHVTDPAPPYSGGAQGLSISTYSPQINVNNNVTLMVPVASIRQLTEYMVICKDLLRNYLYMESDFENLARDFKRYVTKFEAMPVDASSREVGYLRDYVIGIQAEVTALLTGYSRYLLETIFQTLVYVRHCASQYK